MKTKTYFVTSKTKELLLETDETLIPSHLIVHLYTREALWPERTYYKVTLTQDQFSQSLVKYNTNCSDVFDWHVYKSFNLEFELFQVSTSYSDYLSNAEGVRNVSSALLREDINKDNIERAISKFRRLSSTNTRVHIAQYHLVDAVHRGILRGPKKHYLSSINLHYLTATDEFRISIMNDGSREDDVLDDLDDPYLPGSDISTMLEYLDELLKTKSGIWKEYGAL